MSALPPDIQEWETLNLDWQYINQSVIRPRTIPANGQLQLPLADFTYAYPEIIVLHFTTIFDHPTCGLRMEAGPDFDSQQDFTVANLTPLSRPDNLVYTLLPPFIAPGLFGIRVPSAWSFKDWLNLYVINTDSIPHRVMVHTYHLAVLKEKRPDLNYNDLETIKLLLELYPEIKDELKSGIRDKFDYWLKLRELRLTFPRR